MSFRVNKTVSWQAGEGTPIKYTFAIDAILRVEDILPNEVILNLNGTITITNHPTNSRNTWAASDFAVLIGGNTNVTTHPFVYGTSYYEHVIPFLPDPQNSDIDSILVEFRGDTWASDPNNNNNRSSLWMQIQGLVLDQYSQEGTSTFSINISYSVPVPSSGDTIILAWASSGANSSTDYSWQDPETWATWVDLDYRPGATLDTNTSIWKSHNRTNGACHVLPNSTGTNWHECRTAGGDVGAQGNPPLILHAANANSWYNQKRIGREA